MRLARLLTRYAEARLHPLGLGVASYPALTLLNLRGAMTQKALATLLRVEQSSMAQLLARLERDGFAVRETDPNDRRSSLISLTEKATAALPQLSAIMEGGSALAVKGMTDDEVSTLRELLRKMIRNLEAEEERDRG